MGSITEQPVWDMVIYSVDMGNPVLGGEVFYDGDNVIAGYANASAQSLANRTAFLRDGLAYLEESLTFHTSGTTDVHTQYVLKTDLARDVPLASVGVAAPLTITSGRNPVISIPLATESSAGAMSAEDKITLGGLVASSEEGAVTSVQGRTGVVVLTKADVGLGNVDNTSDADKPISTATQTALDNKVTDAPINGQTYIRQNGEWVPSDTASVMIYDFGIQTAGQAISGQALSMDVGLYRYFSINYTGVASQPTWAVNVSFPNIPASNAQVISWHVEIIGGNRRTFNFPSTVKWASGIAPTLTANRCVIMFYVVLNRPSIYGMLVDEGVL